METNDTPSLPEGQSQQSPTLSLTEAASSKEELLNGKTYDLSSLSVGVEGFKADSEEGAKFLSKLENAKAIALKAGKKRVSRRLLLADRAKRQTCVCAETGIVSLLEVPLIPGFALTYQHPLSVIGNARGMAQKGISYLRSLDTQTLAGILITLANHYSLFRYQPADSGAQKNALLRTAGKDKIIDAIVFIETFIHSRNSFLFPQLSLMAEPFSFESGITGKLTEWLRLLAERQEKPDHSVYNPNEVKKVGKPLYIKDIEKKEKKISFLARQEIGAAKKRFNEDKKEGKRILNELYSASKISPKMYSFLSGLMQGDSLLVLEESAKKAISSHEKIKAIPELFEIVRIIEVDRKILLMETSEVEEIMELKAEKETKEKLFSDFTYGSDSEDEEEEEEEQNLAEGTEAGHSNLSAESNLSENDNASSNETDSSNSFTEILHEQAKEQKTQEPPEGLNLFEKILWKKKRDELIKKKSGANGSATARFVSSVIPSATTYTPSAEKQKLGE